MIDNRPQWIVALAQRRPTFSRVVGGASQAATLPAIIETPTNSSSETTMSDRWIADRMRNIDASGIRKVFDLAATMKSPINLSIGQPHFDTPEPIKQALRDAVDTGKNAYSQTQGIKPLLELIQ